MKQVSIFDDDVSDRCYLCGCSGRMDVHHVYGGSCRKTADRMGFVVHLCRHCHSLIHDSADGKPLKDFLHRQGQLIYEERIGDRKQFIRDFVRSYL